MKNKLNKTIGLTSVVIAGATVLPLATAQAEEVVENTNAEVTTATPVEITQAQVDAAKTEADKAKAQVDAITSNKTEVEQDEAKAEETITTTQKQIEEAKNADEVIAEQNEIIADKSDEEKTLTSEQTSAQEDQKTKEQAVALKTEEKTTAETEVKNAETKVAEKQAALDKLTDTKTQEEIRKTEGQIAETDKNIQDLTKEVTAADQDVQTKQTALDNYKPVVKQTTKAEVALGDEELEARPNLAKGSSYEMEVIDFTGRDTVVLPFDPNFKPDAKEIAKHFLNYLNELRALNGIAPVAISDQMMKVSEIRAQEIVEDFSHRSASGQRYRAENIGMNPYIKEERLLSNQEIAYAELLGWFSEYSNVSGASYGHRTALFTAEGNIGLGLSIDAYMEDINDLYLVFNSDARNMERYKSIVESRDAEGRVSYTMGGKTVKFIKNLTFRYVTEEVVEDKTSELQSALNTAKANKTNLDSKLASANQAKTNLESTLDKLNTQANNLAGERAKAQAELTSAQTELKAAQTNLTEKTTALQTAETELTEATRKVTDLANKVQAVRKEITDAETKRDAAQSLKDSLKDLEAKLAEANKDKADATSRKTQAEKDLVKAEENYNTANNEYIRILNLFNLQERLNLKDQSGIIIAVPKTAPTADEKPEIVIEMTKGAGQTAEEKPELSLDLLKTEKTNTQNSVTQVTTKPQGNTEKVLPKTSAKNTGANNSLPLGLASALVAAGLILMRRENEK